MRTVIAQLVVPITSFVVGVLILLSMVVWTRPHHARRRSKEHELIECDCPVCQSPMVIDSEELTPLSAPEMALVVSVQPELYGRRLREYRCSHCDTDHCFAVDRRPAELVATGVFTPRTKVNFCLECRKPLKRPVWPGTDDNELAVYKAEMVPEIGLVCPGCGAVCCYQCVQDVSRNRTLDGSLLCPRCRMGPLEKVHHF